MNLSFIIKMILKINQKTIYTYKGKVNSGYQKDVLTPQKNSNQSIIGWNIIIDGGKTEILSKDHFGNIINLIRMNDGSKQIKISVKGEVKTFDKNGIVKKEKHYIPLWCFSQQTNLTLPGLGLNAFFNKIAFDENNIIGSLHKLSEQIRTNVKYIFGSTNYKTSAESAYKIGEGVCQDHTHIFLSLVRKLNLPARYVSGFFIPNKKQPNLAMHAWAEVWIANLGWVGFDISNGISPDERYVSVGKGFDYNDVVPIKGTIKGMFSEESHSSLKITGINQ